MGNGVLATDYAGFDDFKRISGAGVGATASSKGIISMWFLVPTPLGGLRFMYNRTPNGSLDGIFYQGASSTIRIILKRSVFPSPASTGTADFIVFIDSVTSLATGVWHHLLVSWDHTSLPLKNHMYINDLDDKGSTFFSKVGVVAACDTTDTTTPVHTIGNGNSAPGPSEFDGCISEFYFNLGEFLDFSVPANRRLFIDGLVLPVELGASGSLPTGTAPVIYIPDGDALVNAGTGSNFVASNNPTVPCATVPNPVVLTPRDIIEAVRDEVRVLKVVEPDDKIRSRLSFADDNLTDALSKFDAGDLRKTTKGVRKAVRFLEKAVEKDFSQAQVTDWAERLCSAIRTIADDEITAAIARTGDPVKIAEAQDAFADGDLEKLFQEFLDAIRDYEKAIKSATVA